MHIQLSELEIGETAVIEEVALSESEQQFLMRFGFFAGAKVGCLRPARLGDAIVYSVDGPEIALRAETARQMLASRVDAKTVSEIP